MVKNSQDCCPREFSTATQRRSTKWVGIRGGTFYDRDLVHSLFSTGQLYEQFVLDYLAGLHKLPEGIEAYLLE
jgi:hypothetical protein